MRDSKRIDRILNKIRTIWVLVPDWRLGQLIFNVTSYRGDIFYLDDDGLESFLDEWIETYIEKKADK